MLSLSCDSPVLAFMLLAVLCICLYHNFIAVESVSFFSLCGSCGGHFNTSQISRFINVQKLKSKHTCVILRMILLKHFATDFIDFTIVGCSNTTGGSSTVIYSFIIAVVIQVQASKRQRVDPSLETTVNGDMQPAGLMAKKKPASTSSVVQARTTRQKAASAAAARPAVPARAPPAVNVAKPQPAKGNYIRCNLVMLKTGFKPKLSRNIK